MTRKHLSTPLALLIHLSRGQCDCDEPEPGESGVVVCLPCLAKAALGNIAPDEAYREVARIRREEEAML